MSTVSIKKLIIKANWFESLATELSKFAQEEQQISSKLIDNSSLLSSIRYIFPYVTDSSANFSKEEFKDWFLANQTALGGIKALNDQWSPWLCFFDKKKSEISTQNGDIFTKITGSSDPPEILDISEEAVLMPTENIPRLWLWRGKNIFITEKGKYSLFDPIIGNNQFIATAINKIFPNHFSPRDENEVKYLSEFISDNMSKIEKMKTFFEYPQPIPVGAGGVDGYVFKISDKNILKIFKDTHAYQKAKEAEARLYTDPEFAGTEAVIYDVDELGKYYNVPLYYYIMELMTPVESFDLKVKDAVATLANEIMDSIAAIKNNYDEYKHGGRKFDNKLKLKINQDAKKIANEMKIANKQLVLTISKELSIPRDVSGKLKRDPAKKSVTFEESGKENLPEEIINLQDDWLEKLCEELIIKYLTGRTDTHLGNLGVTRYGYLRYFDPAFSLHQSHFNKSIVW